jgi:predicted flap endonuclease-1-like 5' DNA nuclease
MRPFQFLPWLLTGFLGGAGAAAWLLQKEPAKAPPPKSMTVPAVPPPLTSSTASVALGETKLASVQGTPPFSTQTASTQSATTQSSIQELEQWKQRAVSVQAQLKDVEASLLSLRDELNAVQGWQAKMPSLVRLGQSLARLPSYKAAAADAALAAGQFPTVSLDCQDLSIIDGIGETYEQRLYKAGVGTFWELANVDDAELRQILHISDLQMRTTDFSDIRLQARQLAVDTNSTGLLWDGEAPDDFSRIKGIGRTYEQRLYDAGIRTYRSLAASKAEDLAAILGPQIFHPQINQWITQAQALAAAQSPVQPPV